MTTMISMRLTEDDKKTIDAVQSMYRQRNRTATVQMMAKWFAENRPDVTITAQKKIRKNS